MFGYIRCDRDELKWKDYQQYSSYYCALCHTLGRKFGFPYRIMLSNDAAFLLICLNALSSNTVTMQKRCPTNPLKKTIVEIDPGIVEYVAGLNYYLMQRKMIDNMQDTKSGVKKWFVKIFHSFIVHNRAYVKWMRQHDKLVNKLDRKFEELYEAENKSCNFDYLTNRFGEIAGSFADGLTGYTEKSDDIAELSILFFNIGKWIYLADALDDYTKDMRNEEFNLLQTLHVAKNQELEQQYIQMCHTKSMQIKS